MKPMKNIFSGNKKALIVFDCAGFPDMQTSEKRINEILSAGADIVELGIPFSDPMADGSVIQEAYQTALQNGADLSNIIVMLKNIRNAFPDKGLIISGYCNIFLQYGYEKLFAELAEMDIDAIRILDLPAEEFAEIAPYAEKSGVKVVITASSTTSDDRLQKLLALPGSIVYCDNAQVAAKVKAQTALPAALKCDNSFDAMIVEDAAVKTFCGKLADLVKAAKNEL